MRGTPVKQEINAVFAQSVAEWDVVIDAAYTVHPSVLEKLDEGESGMLASFPKNMRDFIQTFKKERDEDKSAYYLFIIPGNKGKRAGFMPFKRQFGFIYPANTNNTARAIAHELGHGAFRLRHTFSPEAFVASQGKTNNLMDYPAGPELRKYQWDNVHEPESMNGWFEDDAEVAMLADAEIPAGYIPECGTEGKPPIVEKLILYSKTCSSHFEGSVTNLLNKGYGAFLCASERFAVIKCLANGLMPSHKEDAIIKLISGTPSVQAAEFLQYLKEDNSGILRKIDNGFQLGNYVGVFKAIQQLYLSGTTQAVINAEAEKISSTFSSDQSREEKAQQNYFTWFEGGMLKEILSNNFIFNRFDDVNIADDGTVSFNYATDPKQTGETTTSLKIKPFALVGIRVRGNTNEVLEAGNGNMVYVPGIMLPLLVSKKETAEFLDGLNLAAVVTGVGTITTGTSRFLIAVGGIDVLLGSSALVVDSYKDDILKMSHGQEFLDAYILVNKAFLIYFSARSIVQVTQALPKLQSSYSTFKHSDDFVKLKVTNSSKAAQIENEVEQILKKGEDLAKGADDIKAFDFKISDATESQLAALDHAFKRHGDELSQIINKPIKWTKKSELQGMLDNFNEAVSLIRNKGKLTGKANVPFGIKGSGNGSVPTDVDVFIYNHIDNKEYYLYLRSSDQKFVSGGLTTKKINYTD